LNKSRLKEAIGAPRNRTLNGQKGGNAILRCERTAERTDFHQKQPVAARKDGKGGVQLFDTKKCAARPRLHRVQPKGKKRGLDKKKRVDGKEKRHFNLKKAEGTRTAEESIKSWKRVLYPPPGGKKPPVREREEAQGGKNRVRDLNRGSNPRGNKREKFSCCPSL